MTFDFRLALAALALAGCAPAASAPAPVPAAPIHYGSPDSALKSLPFSEAVQVGDLLFLSGQIGVAPGTLTLVTGGMEPEAIQALENIKSVLGRHGSSMDRVVKCTVFLADMRDWPAFNVIYRRYFTGPIPARSALGANGLALGAKVEVECIASR
ncbi:MAG TPA: Rid family detoxifying hydrolase [Gemmatimonadales bacterium]|nr:Rid family detoxifying hydrolase [Gemmatimonadales bacterium]